MNRCFLCGKEIPDGQSVCRECTRIVNEYEIEKTKDKEYSPPSSEASPVNTPKLIKAFYTAKTLTLVVNCIIAALFFIDGIIKLSFSLILTALLVLFAGFWLANFSAAIGKVIELLDEIKNRK
jgi:hypothetical protein